jgi:hypothetical protein
MPAEESGRGVAKAETGMPMMDTRTRWALGVILAALGIAVVVAAVAGSA